MQQRDIRGFTLVEILVAMIIVAVSLVGNYALFARTTQQSQHGLYAMRASRLAVSAIDRLRVHGGLDNTLFARCTAGEPIACTRYLERNAAIETLRSIAARTIPSGQFELRRQGTTHWRVIVQWQAPLSATRDHYHMSVPAS